MPKLITRNIIFFTLGGAAGASHGATFTKGDHLIPWIVGSISTAALLFILGLAISALVFGSNETD